MENAVIRGTDKFPVSIFDNCLIGPNAHLTGCTVEDNVFIATGASIFHGATLKTGSEVSIYGVDRPKSGEPNNMIEICKVMSDRLKSHIDNEIIYRE